MYACRDCVLVHRQLSEFEVCSLEERNCRSLESDSYILEATLFYAHTHC